MEETFLNGSEEMFVTGEVKRAAKVKVKLRETLRKHTGSSLARNILLMFMRPVRHLEGGVSLP